MPQLPLGSLDAYLDRVSRVPMLSREDEQALAQRFRADGDVEGGVEAVAGLVEARVPSGGLQMPCLLTCDLAEARVVNAAARAALSA